MLVFAIFRFYSSSTAGVSTSLVSFGERVFYSFSYISLSLLSGYTKSIVPLPSLMWCLCPIAALGLGPELGPAKSYLVFGFSTFWFIISSRFDELIDVSLSLTVFLLSWTLCCLGGRSKVR